MRSTTSWPPWCVSARRLAIAGSRSRSSCRSPNLWSPGRRAAVAANKRPRLRAVLWDLDGTLTDSVHLVVETMNSVISAHGGPALPYEKAGQLTGLPLDAMFRLAWPDIGAADVDRYRVEYRSRYDAVAIPATRLFRGARAALRDFHSAGLMQATVTGKRAADCERILRGLGIKKDIDIYLGGDSVPRPKPAPDLALHAMSRLGVSPEESVVIGDSSADIAMGKASGAHTIQVLWGFLRSSLPESERSVRTWTELRSAVHALGGPKPILGRRGPLRP